MSRVFVHELRLPRTIFGRGSLERLTNELVSLQAGKVVLICTARRGDAVEQASSMLGDRLGGIYDQTRPHAPVELVEEVGSLVASVGADHIVAVGGGSAIGLAKAVAVGGGPRYVAIPTTYSGSEMTSVWGLTREGRKTTGRDPRALAAAVIYDPDLTTSLPAAETAYSGFNAIAHAAEALYAPEATPITSLLAREAAGSLAGALATAVAQPTDAEARETVLLGAWMAAASMSSVSMGLHHRICHVLGGDFGLPHAQVHTVVLPHVIAFNEPAARKATGELAQALAGEHAPSALYDLAETLGCTLSLREIGLAEVDLDRAATRTMDNPYPNPRAYAAREVRAILQRAWLGRRPNPTPRDLIDS